MWSNLKLKKSNILFKYLIAFPKLSLLKNTHPIVTKMNVNKTLKKSLIESNPFFSPINEFKYFLLLFNQNEGVNKAAWKIPHITKVQFAPCHKPLIMKTIKIFLNAITFLTLDPPRGMYI